MRNVLKRLGIVPILLLTLGAWQCSMPHTPYGRAVKVGVDITDALNTGASTADKLRINGTITVDEERNALKYMQTANNLTVDVYGPCVQAAHLAGDKAASFLSCANSLNASLANPGLLNDLHVSNPKSQATLQQISGTVINLAQAGVTLFTTLQQKGQ